VTNAQERENVFVLQLPPDQYLPIETLREVCERMNPVSTGGPAHLDRHLQKLIARVNVAQDFDGNLVRLEYYLPNPMVNFREIAIRKV
jgi:hypothetical protein